MATFKTFEEIECWKTSRELTNRIYRASNRSGFSRDFRLKDQIRRASVSVMSNIAEGHDRGGTAEFIQFLSTAKGSAAEVRCQLYVALDQAYITQTEFVDLSEMANEVSRMIGGLMSYLKGAKYKGTKYKKRLSIDGNLKFGT